MIEYIASNIKSNIREFGKGAFSNKIIAYANLEKREIYIYLAEQVLRDIISRTRYNGHHYYICNSPACYLCGSPFTLNRETLRRSQRQSISLFFSFITMIKCPTFFPLNTTVKILLSPSRFTEAPYPRILLHNGVTIFSVPIG